MKQIVVTTLGIAQWKHHESYLRICKHRETRYHPKILMKSLSHKWLNKLFRSHWCAQNTKIQIKSEKTKRKWYRVIQPLWRPSYTLKAFMVKTLAAIIKKQEPHLMWDLLYAYHLLMKGKHKQGICWHLHLFKCILNKTYMCLKPKKLLWFWTNVVWFNVLSWFSSLNPTLGSLSRMDNTFWFYINKI
jgi:hypothetical protein